ncbi:uncharacterized protein LOC109861718, partial [Pseudomyrmex gracilis]|uniref:uncharacterized protein LOC109861718 n=1 Tax=Pseudomyrmex gracilis TaxID=219809 RepID=UPI000995761C
NLLPMTADDVSFSVFWVIYSGLVWLIEIVQAIVLTAGCMKVSKEKALRDGLIGLAVTVEVIFFLIQISLHKDLMLQLIRKLNIMLRLKDELMRNTVIIVLKPIDVPLKVSWFLGEMAIIAWAVEPLLLIFQKNMFFYEDYRMPVVFSKEPFSTSIFVMGSLIVLSVIYDKRIVVYSIRHLGRKICSHHVLC